jgi:hypothetical protein
LVHDCHPTVLRWDLLQDNRVSGVIVPSEFVFSMSRIVNRSPSQAAKTGAWRRGVPLPAFVPPQLSQLVEKPPAGAQWVHEIKLDGYRMAARIDNGRVQLLTRTGLDWTAKYPSAIAALANLTIKTAYLDGELCGSTNLDCRASPIPRPRRTAKAEHGSSITRSIFCTSTAATSPGCR